MMRSASWSFTLGCVSMSLTYLKCKMRFPTRDAALWTNSSFPSLLETNILYNCAKYALVSSSLKSGTGKKWVCSCLKDFHTKCSPWWGKYHNGLDEVFVIAPWLQCKQQVLKLTVMKTVTKFDYNNWAPVHLSSTTSVPSLPQGTWETRKWEIIASAMSCSVKLSFSSLFHVYEYGIFPLQTLVHQSRLATATWSCHDDCCYKVIHLHSHFKLSV